MVTLLLIHCAVYVQADALSMGSPAGYMWLAPSLDAPRDKPLGLTDQVPVAYSKVAYRLGYDLTNNGADRVHIVHARLLLGRATPARRRPVPLHEVPGICCSLWAGAVGCPLTDIM